MQFLETLTKEVAQELDTSHKDAASAHSAQYLHSQLSQEWGRVQETQKEAKLDHFKDLFAVPEEDTSAVYARLGW